MTALELGAAVRAREIGVVELTRAALDAAAESQAFITICETEAIERAKCVQERVDNGDASSPLAGVPMGLEDCISTRGVRTTCASKMLSGYTPVFDAAVVEKLYNADAVLIGKMNTDEFGLGPSAFGAAFAARAVPYALGGDMGGGVRQSASGCGVTGFLPTYGAVSRWGVIASSSSLGQAGPIAKDARDCAAVLSVLCGEDPRDAMTTAFDFPPIPSEPKVNGLRIALPREAFGNELDGAVKDAVLEAAKALESMGAHVDWIGFPMFEYAAVAHYIIASAECASNLSCYDGIHCGRGVDTTGLLYDGAVFRARSEGFGWAVKSRMMLGNLVLSEGNIDKYYNKALKARAMLCDAFRKAFSEWDIILTPTTPAYTVPANLAGLPGLSLPCGFAGGLPVGMQFMGAPFSDGMLLAAGAAYQCERGRG